MLHSPSLITLWKAPVVLQRRVKSPSWLRDTPGNAGKTKHFQTLNVTARLTLCDCPGLVLPRYAASKAEMVAAGAAVECCMRQVHVLSEPGRCITKSRLSRARHRTFCTADFGWCHAGVVDTPLHATRAHDTECVLTPVPPVQPACRRDPDRPPDRRARAHRRDRAAHPPRRAGGDILRAPAAARRPRARRQVRSP